MKLGDRITLAEKLIEAMKAELIGLRSVYHGYEDSSHCFTQEHARDGYQRGRMEALDILQKGEGR